MKNRGNMVEAGSRIEYVLVQHPDSNPKLYERIEDPSYVMEHSDLLHIDPIYYAQNMINPIDQALEICFKEKKVVEKILDIHIRFKTVLGELEWYFHPYEFHDLDGSVHHHPSVAKFVRNQQKRQKKQKTQTSKKKEIVKKEEKKKKQVSIVDMMKDLLKK